MIRRLLGWLALALALLLVGAAPADAAFFPPPPSIALEPNCGPPGVGPPTPPPIRDVLLAQPMYSITVLGRNLAANQEWTVVFNPGATQQSFGAASDGNGNLDVVINPVTVPAGTYTVDLQPVGFEEAVVAGPRAQFVVPCPPAPVPTPTPTVSPTPRQSPSEPGPSASASPPPRVSPPPVLDSTLTLTPAVGPAGTIVVARGADFPPNVAVQVAWSQGIVSDAPSAITTDASGAFTTSVLVFPHDELGARVLTAVSAPPQGTTYIGFASASFLVVAGAVQPNDFSWRH